MAIELTPAAKGLLAAAGSTRCWARGRCAARSRRDRGPAVGEEFVEVQPGQIVIVDVEGLDPNAPEGSRAADDKPRFTFRGDPKPPAVPVTPPVDTAQVGGGVMRDPALVVAACGLP